MSRRLATDRNSPRPCFSNRRPGCCRVLRWNSRCGNFWTSTSGGGRSGSTWCFHDEPVDRISPCSIVDPQNPGSPAGVSLCADGYPSATASLAALSAAAPAPVVTATPASAPPPAWVPAQAERRQLTVMFCDLVGSRAKCGLLTRVRARVRARIRPGKRARPARHPDFLQPRCRRRPHATRGRGEVSGISQTRQRRGRAGAFLKLYRSRLLTLRAGRADPLREE